MIYASEFRQLVDIGNKRIEAWLFQIPYLIFTRLSNLILQTSLLSFLYIYITSEIIISHDKCAQILIVSLQVLFAFIIMILVVFRASVQYPIASLLHLRRYYYPSYTQKGSLLYSINQDILTKYYSRLAILSISLDTLGCGDYPACDTPRLLLPPIPILYYYLLVLGFPLPNNYQGSILSET